MSPPSCLKVKKDSHSIQKPSSSATSTNSSTSSHRNRPIIIYTSSPKVIHTEPNNFMALVQKLTGLSNSVEEVNNNNNVENVDNVNGDDVHLSCSSVQSKSLSPSEGASVSKVPVSNFLCPENVPPFTDLELMEMISPLKGWDFGIEDDQDFF